MDEYILSDKIRERKTTVSATQINSGMGGNIREAILQYDANAYSRFFSLVDSNTRKIPLHASRGSKLAQKGRVISFSVAGSGYAQMPQPQKRLAGMDNIWVTEQDTGKRVHLRKGEPGKTYLFVTQDGEEIPIPGENLEEFAADIVTQVYGKPYDDELPDIRVKTNNAGTKTKYSIAGPKITIAGNEYNGFFNAGEYSIEKTRDYIKTLGELELKKLLNSPDFINSGEDIFFNFSGHSRGGVGVIQGAMMLKHLINTKYPELYGRVHFNALLYDPVPGPKDRIDDTINHVVNLKEQTHEMKELGMDPFDAGDHSTVLYSFGCQYPANLFNPLKVLGADTIILTGHNHSEGLADIEMQGNNARRKAYINAENGEAYRASGLNEMPGGVFIADENGVMVKAKDSEMVNTIYERAYTNTDLIERLRQTRIQEACNDVHVRSGETPSYSNIVSALIQHDPFYIRSSPEFRGLRNQMEKLDKLMRQKNRDPKAEIETENKIREYAMAYVTLKSGKGPHSNRTQGRINVAKDIILFLDHVKENDLKWYASRPLDQTERTNDIRAAYLSNCENALAQSTRYMQRICDFCKRETPIEEDMVRQTLAGMMADRYFLTHREQFMPKPVTEPGAQKELTQTLDPIVGYGKGSLYAAFRGSGILNSVANQVLDGSITQEMFSDPNWVNNKLDSMIAHAVRENYSRQETIRTPGKDTSRSVHASANDPTASGKSRKDFLI